MSRLWTATLLAGFVSALAPASARTEKAAMKPMINVTNSGAKGDGETDDTAAFNKAFQEATARRGGTVFAPTGNYLIATHLEIPPHVVLRGEFEAPTARTQMKGTTLLAVEGAGNPEGTPFITLRENSTLKGLTIFYPNQTPTNPPIAYPWTVRGIGDNCSIVDVLMVNPYQAVDFGTEPAGRHYIKGLYAQALFRGIFVDKCFDVGRIEDVHLWPFWNLDEKFRQFTLDHGEAFILGRTDWEYMLNCFCIGYRVGFRFIAAKNGPGNVVLTQCGSDVGPTAVRVEDCQAHAGISFVNGQFMAGIEVEKTNTGPVKFTSCGFWGINTTENHARIAGRGHVTFSSCHFNGWDRKKTGAPCLQVNGEGITVIGCDFMDEGKSQISLGPEVKAAIVVGNRFRGGTKVENLSQGSIQLGLNADR
jgi:hypothetical protein